MSGKSKNLLFAACESFLPVAQSFSHGVTKRNFASHASYLFKRMFLKACWQRSDGLLGDDSQGRLPGSFEPVVHSREPAVRLIAGHV
jgi:hypothetical protein